MDQSLYTLAGIVAGGLLVVLANERQRRASQDDSRSTREFSLDLAKMSLARLDSVESEMRRSKAIEELSLQIQKLEVVTSNVFRATMGRTVVTRASQYGEEPPTAPAWQTPPARRPEPEPGQMVDPPAKPPVLQSAAAQVGESVSAARS